jgi:hypothetical protein
MPKLNSFKDKNTVNDIINSVAVSSTGKPSANAMLANRKLQQMKKLFMLPERKYLCVVCQRKFKRTRDLQIHVQIMHKQISDAERQQIQLEIQKTNQLIKSNQSLLLEHQRKAQKLKLESKFKS